MFSVVTFKWKPIMAYRSKFSATHVNSLRRQFEVHCRVPHRFICITDDPNGLDSQIEAVKIWDDFKDIPNPTWLNGPRCYRRLLTFGEAFRQIAGDRFLCIDLDVLLTGDVTPLVEREEDFLMWGTDNADIPFCGSMYMMTTGVHEEVLGSFDPIRSPILSEEAGYRGSDQAWIRYCIGDDIATWNRKNDGVYSYQDYIMPKCHGRLPTDARVVMFHGKPDYWDQVALQRSPWIREHALWIKEKAA